MPTYRNGDPVQIGDRIAYHPDPNVLPQFIGFDGQTGQPLIRQFVPGEEGVILQVQGQFIELTMDANPGYHYNGMSSAYFTRLSSAPILSWTSQTTPIYPVGAEVEFNAAKIKSVSILSIKDTTGVWTNFDVTTVLHQRGVVTQVDGLIRYVKFPFHPYASLFCSVEYLVSSDRQSSTSTKSNGVCVCDVNALMRGGCACGAVTCYRPPGIIS